MALTKCRECHGQISDRAKACPHCGAEIRRTSALTGCFAIFLGLMLIVFVVALWQTGGNLPSSSPSPCEKISTATAWTMIDSAKTAGIVYGYRLNTADPRLLTVQVADLWTQLPLEAKRAMNVALLCGLIKETARYHIDYYDYRSGQRLARSNWAEDLVVELPIR